MKQVKWVIINTIFGILLFYATYGQIGGAYNLVTFVCWLSFFSGVAVVAS